MSDKFFTQTNCDRCYGALAPARIMSYFNKQTICLTCADQEVQLRKKLNKQGVDTKALEGCGHIPELKEDYMITHKTIVYKKVLKATIEYIKLGNRTIHPSGVFDAKRRWYPDIVERSSCCTGVREPSASYPFSLMTHCRTAIHVATKYQVGKNDILSHTKILEALGGLTKVEEHLEELPDKCTLQEVRGIMFELLI